MKIVVAKGASGGRVVVHKAGIMPLSAIGSGDVDHFYRVIAMRFRSTFMVLERAPGRHTRGGRIVVFSRSTRPGRRSNDEADHRRH